MPLHWFRQARRGYNQSREIALGISEVTGIPVGSHLSARPHGSQTRRNATSRSDNAEGTYSAKECSPIDGRHILIVDDIITTGSTMRSCAAALHAAAPQSAISVLAIGRRGCREPASPHAAPLQILKNFFSNFGQDEYLL